MHKRFLYSIFVLFMCLLTDNVYSYIEISSGINGVDTFDGKNENGKETKIFQGKYAIILARFKLINTNIQTGVEAKISDITWAYTVSADSSVVCIPKHGTGNEARITVTSRKTGTYAITVNVTVSYKITKYRPNGTIISSENKTETSKTILSLIVERPGNIKLVDVRHVFNYSPMDMTGKWKIGKDELLIGVDNNNKIKLKFTGLTGTYEYSVGGDLIRPFTSIANDTPFEIEVTGDSEKIYQITLKDASGNESTWKVTGFSKEWRNSRINSLGWNAWGGGRRGYSFAQNLLNTFLKSTSPTNCTSATASQNVTDTRLTHNCGADFNSTTSNASVPKYTFGASSSVSTELSKFKGVLGAWTKYIAQATVTGYDAAKYPQYPTWLNSGGFAATRASDYTALKAKFDATAIGDTFKYTFLPKSGGANFESGDSPDMYYAIHSCTINFTKIEYTYKKTTAKEAETQSIVLQATISDLYDFNYGTGGTGNAAKAATVQIGAVRDNGVAGQIFQVEIIIDKSLTSLDTSIWTSNYYHKLTFP